MFLAVGPSIVHYQNFRTGMSTKMCFQGPLSCVWRWEAEGISRTDCLVICFRFPRGLHFLTSFCMGSLGDLIDFLSSVANTTSVRRFIGTVLVVVSHMLCIASLDVKK